jgi:hypothetical protein
MIRAAQARAVRKRYREMAPVLNEQSNRQRAQGKIGKQRLLLVARKHDADVSDKHDENIAMRLLRAVERTVHDIAPTAGKPGYFNKLKKGDTISGYLFLVPEECDASKCGTMRALEDEGCVLLDGCPVGDSYD